MIRTSVAVFERYTHMSGNINDSNDGAVITSSTQSNRYTSYADGKQLSTAVVMALADVAGVDPAEIGVPLYDVIDPDALDNIFSDKHDGTPRKGGNVVFTILNYEVTVQSYGEISIRELRIICRLLLRSLVPVISSSPKVCYVITYQSGRSVVARIQYFATAPVVAYMSSIRSSRTVPATPGVRAGRSGSGRSGRGVGRPTSWSCRGRRRSPVVRASSAVWSLSLQTDVGTPGVQRLRELFCGKRGEHPYQVVHAHRRS